MRRRESRYPDDWFRVGEKELKRAKFLLRAPDLSGAGFNIHQTVEKYLKGFLLSRGWELRRIHDLEALLNEAGQHHSAFESFRPACRKMNQYYLEERYPYTVPSDLTKDEIEESLQAAEKLVREIRQLVK